MPLPNPLRPLQRDIRLAIVTNIPAPYRVPVYNRVGACDGIVLRVFYASQTEANRLWDLPAFEHDHVFLNGSVFERAGRYIHHAPDLLPGLSAFKPDVVITTGFNPLHLAAFAYTTVNACRHIAMTDGTTSSEAGLSWAHGVVRRLVFSGSRTFIAASEGGRRLFRGYGIDDARIHFSPLCANESVPWRLPIDPGRDIDLLFSGRLVPIKNADFAIKVASQVAQTLGRRVRIALLGDGPLEGALRAQARANDSSLDVVFAGHVSQSDIPGWFARARVFVFPTLWDPWGVVANEACLAGVPVVVSPHAGVADELVRDGINGYVLPLDLGAWSGAVTRLLTDGPLHQRMSAAARKAVEPYSFKNAAAGIVDATRHAFGGLPEAPVSTFARRQRVVCIQRRLTHYRVPLFNAMKADLAVRGIDFAVLHGNPAPSELTKSDSGELSWAHFVPCTYWAGERICWQNPGKLINSADLVIVTQENKLVFNLLAMIRHRAYRLAFWGHGRNMQASNPRSMRERFKNWTTQKVQWWFAYTALSARTVHAAGFPSDRTTDVQNSIDTQQLIADCQSVTEVEIAALRRQLALGDGPLGVFIGSLYPDKRLDFLLQAAEALAQERPSFRLIIVGSGPAQGDIVDAAQRLPWLRYVGRKLGRDKALYLRAATLMLNPGLVGLGVLDAFAAGLPMVTTDCNLHSPEIAYLRHGENGLMTADNLPAFIAACTDLLADPDKRQQLAAAARADAQHYTLQNMARRFGDGIVAALGSARR